MKISIQPSLICFFLKALIFLSCFHDIFSQSDTRFYIRGGGYIDGTQIDATSSQIAIKTKVGVVVVKKIDIVGSRQLQIVPTIVVKPMPSVETENINGASDAIKPEADKKSIKEGSKNDVSQGNKTSEVVEPQPSDKERPASTKEASINDVPPGDKSKKNEAVEPSSSNKEQAAAIKEPFWSDKAREFLDKLKSGSFDHNEAASLLGSNENLLGEIVRGYCQGTSYTPVIEDLIIRKRLDAACDCILNELDSGVEVPNIVGVIKLFTLMRYLPARIYLANYADRKELKGNLDKYFDAIGPFDETNAGHWLLMISPKGFGIPVAKTNIQKLITQEPKKAMEELLDVIDDVPVKAKETALEIVADSAKLLETFAEKVVSFLDDEDALCRAYAVKAIARMNYPDSIEKLSLLASKEEDRFVRIQIAHAMREFKSENAIMLLFELLADKENEVKMAAKNSLEFITGMNLGTDPDKWKEWWEKEKRK